ncbi:MAG: serine/threonine protein kinase [Vicinamibacteria bacterium]|nr:serine/threonine protein kinase [Vicinamibacteria bacterium]
MNGLPETVGRYQLLRELGRGMMGVVYLAKDPDLGRDIALKIIQLPPGATPSERAAFEQRFFSEAQSAARLTHPGIVIVHDVGRDAASGALYMALQLLPGQTLDNLLRSKNRLEWREALRITRRVAEALEHAHSEGVVHRDIKPANIMILPSGDPKIMDFGIAKIETERLTATGQFIGTPLYMSPEQAMARPVDGRSDIFSLGSVLYEMLTGIPAFDGESVTKILFQLMSTEPEPPSARVSSLPSSIDSILRRCLAKDVTLRYPNAQALADDITAIIGPGTDASRVPAAVPGSGTEVAENPLAPLVNPSGDRRIPEDWTSLETRFLPGSPALRRRRALMVAGGVMALAIAALEAWILLSPPPPVARRVETRAEPEQEPEAPSPPPEPEPRPTPAPTRPANQAARLTIDFEHSLKGGVFRVYVDDLKVIDEPFGGRVTKKIVGLEMRKGRLTETLEVTPGLRTLKVEVLWDDNIKTERSQTYFNPGSRLRLKAKLGSMGGLRKDLSLDWN